MRSRPVRNFKLAEVVSSPVAVWACTTKEGLDLYQIRVTRAVACMGHVPHTTVFLDYYYLVLSIGQGI